MDERRGSLGEGAWLNMEIIGNRPDNRGFDPD